MKKTTMTNKTRNSKVVRAGAILSALLMLLLPAVGVGNFATAARAEVAADDTTLSVFTVNGTAVTSGDTVNVPNGTTSVTVVATPTNENASRVITGDTGLITGNNTLQVVVTAADSVATATYTVTIAVSAFSNDTSLQTFKVDGTNVVDGSTVRIALGRTSVSVEAVPTNAFATATIAGNTSLVTGANQVTVTVTADDGTVQVYTVTVNVAASSSDTSLTSVSIDGNSFSVAEDGSSTYNAAIGTTEVSVAVVASSSAASVTVSGNTGLTVGDNTVTINVVAEDGTSKTYTFKVVVAAANTDTSLSTFKVNGTTVSNGSVVELAFGTTDVTVEAVTTAGTSTYTVSGASSLAPGNNNLVVTVTAQSGATQDYVVTLTVLVASSNKTISSITVNGVAVVANAVTLPSGTSTANVVAVLADSFASYTVSGDGTVSTGQNVVTITVTAQDGSTAQTDVTITVAAPSTESGLASISVDGASVAVGGSVSKPVGTSSVVVVASAVSDKAAVTVSGQDVLVPGANTVTVTVTAESGASSTYTFTVNVARSANTGVSKLLVENTDVTVSKAFTAAFGVTDVEVTAVTADADATFAVSGNTGLVTGVNSVVVTVTAADGVTTEDYVIQVTIPAASTESGLASISVDGASVAVGGSVSKPVGTSSVVVVASAVSDKATVTVSGQDVLVPGSNTVTVTVTAESGASSTYTFTVDVARSADTGVSKLLVENTDVTVSKAFTASYGVTDVEVNAVTADADATFAVSGNTGLVTGVNSVVVTVTAADGVTTEDYVIQVTIPAASTNTALGSVTINGVSLATTGATLPGALDHGTTTVEVVAEAADANASVSISGQDVLVTGANTITVLVTAESGATATYEYIVNVAGSSDATLASILVNGKSVTVSETVVVSGNTTEVTVVALANDADATVEVSGNSQLVAGNNTVTITITAGAGNTATYTFVVQVPTASNNANLAFFTVNGVDALTTQTIEVVNEITEAVVIAQAEEANATLSIPADLTLAVGDNTITVTVTSESGLNTQTYSVVVKRAAALSSNTNLTSITVNGESVVEGGTFEVANGTTSVDVVAVAEDVNASVAVSGAIGLVTGNNTVTIVVTAENGSVAEYTFTVAVAQSANNNLASVKANGVLLDLADLKFTVGRDTSSVVIAALPEDAEATIAVTGADSLQYGDNEVVVTVTAANGTTKSYTVLVTRTPLSNNNNIGSVSINGFEVAVDGTFEVDPGVTSVEVVATAEDSEASASVAGTTNLQPGNNQVVVTITAANGDTADYIFNVFVKSLSNDTSLKLFTIDGTAVQDGDQLPTLDGTKNFVTVVAQANDANAVVAIAGSTELEFGTNEVVVTVTAEDGTVATYTVTVVYPNIRDTSLAALTVNGVDALDVDRFEFDYGVSEVEVVVTPTDPGATVDVTGADGLVSGENTLTISVTAVDGETIEEYTIVLFVAFNSDASLAAFQINGTDVVDGGTITVDPYTTEVEVTAEATDPDATVEIEGADAIVLGDNFVTVTVTAADGSVVQYSVTVVVPLGNDVTLSLFQVNGEDVEDAGTLDLQPGTTSVEVAVETTDPDATFVVAGTTGLVKGANTLTVTVTAADGSATTATYTVTLNVPLNNTVTLSTFQINAIDVEDGVTFNVEYGTTEVEVLAEPTDELATVVIAGGTDLKPGENSVVVTVTAEDGETTAEYTVTVVVALNSDTSLAVFTVNGVDVQDGEELNFDYGTAEVQVVAEATDPEATVDISGGTDLVSGDNELLVTVTAADGETIQEYRINLVVAFNSDTSLGTFQVNGVDVLDGDTVLLPPYTTEADITAEPTDPDATVEIEGGTELVSGDNAVTITVTAADKETSSVYNITLQVALGNDVTITAIQINGEEAEDGGEFVLPAETTNVDVSVETTDPDASYVVEGADGLVLGDNILTITVTAADGSATATYTVTLKVPSNDTSLSEFTVDGKPVESGDYVELPLGTTEVEVVVATTDEAATFEIDGGTNLEPGENALTVTVTAADGLTVQEHVVTLFVLLSDDTSLSVFTVNGEAVEDGSYLELPPYTEDVAVEAVATNEDAQVDIAGADGLQPGENSVVVTVTAADGETVATYVVIVNVILATETGVTEILVDGQIALDKDVILASDPELTEVDVEVTAVDENATVEISGNTDLVKGDNLITITVTAQNGDSAEYTVTFRIGGLPGNAKLKSLLVGGTSIDITKEGQSVTLPAGAKSVAVLPTTEDAAASVKVLGNRDLVSGDNTVTVTVTGADGKTVRDYVVTVTVAALSSNSNVSTIKVNGTTVLANGTVTLAAGARFAEIVATAEDAAATVSYSGFKNLVDGNNTATIRVTAANGSFSDYTVTLVVPTLSNDVSLKTFTIEGFNVLNRSRISVLPGTTKLRVTAQANFAGASVSISGRDVVAGINEVVVTVTAADGTTATYTVRVKA